jgi:nicotinamidase-related amidase
MSMAEPSDTAVVIVVDLQTAMFSGVLLPPIHDADALVERVRSVIDWARRSGHPVAFVRHDGPSGDELAPGEPGWPLWPALGRAESEPIFSKTVGDAFSEPALGDWVAQRGAHDVILLGAQTDECIAATVRGALERGLGVSVVDDAHSTWDSNGESAAAIVARYNVGFAAAGARVLTTEALTSSLRPT